MSIADKYELLTSLSDQLGPPDLSAAMDVVSSPAGVVSRGDGKDAVHSSFARHLRLERLAHLYRIPKSVDKLCLNKITHAMSNLDHALIPRVIDLIEDGQTYDLVTEFVPPEVWVPPTELFERLRVLEQIASALCDASKLGLAHGAIDARSLRVERVPSDPAQGNVKLEGIGIEQLFTGDSLSTLKANDLRTLREWIEACLSQALASLNSDEEEATEVRALLAFQKRLTQEDDSMEVFSGDFRVWLHRELAIQEAKKLAVVDRDVGEDAVNRRKQIAIVAVASTLLLVAAGLVGFAFFGPDSGRGLQDPLLADAGNDQSVDHVVAPPVTSSLSEVGELNKAANPVIEVAPELAVGEARIAPASDPRDGATPAGKVPDSDSLAEATVVGVETTLEAAEAKPGDNDGSMEAATNDDVEPTVDVNPFEGLSNTTDLPKLGGGKVARLLTTSLEGDTELRVELRSPISKNLAFRLTESSSTRWQIRLDKRSEELRCAELALNSGKLFFRWLPEATSTSSSNQLRNSVLTLTSGKWSHSLALRSPMKKPGIRFDLEKSTPISLRIEAPPSETFLEFIPSKDSLATASPEQIGWKSDSTMRIGLDAGKKSLFVVQLQPVGKTKLRAKTYARQRENLSGSLVKKGFGRRLKSGLMTLNRNLYQMKQGVASIKGEKAGERKERARAVIKNLETQKKAAEQFVESYATARASRVGLRVYSQVDDYKLVLAEFLGE